MSVTHEPDRRRFVLPVSGGDASVEYALVGPRTLDLRHTFVPEVDRGRGVAASLVEQVFRYARDHELKVIATCPFVRAWVEEHPEYRDVVE
jgi:predicted GNAT family acetyltransferase